MDADVVNFSLFPVSPKFSASGGYFGCLEGRPTVTFDKLLDETKLRHQSVDKKQLKVDVEHLLDTAAAIAGDRLVNIQFGDYLLLRPFLTGKFHEKSDEYDPAVNTVILRALCRKELKVDYSKFTFRNNTPGKKLKLESVNSANADDTKTLKRLLDICLNGANMNLLPPDDYVEFVCTLSDNTERKGRLEILHSDVKRITCRWPEALDASTVGCKVVFTVCGRCGDEDARQQTVTLKKPVAIVAGEPPEPTGPAPELERGYSEGEGHPDGQVFPNSAFILQGVNLDGAAVKIGYTEAGAYREVDVPDEKLTVTDTVITIASDSVELEDAIMSGSANVTFKVTTAGGSATYEAEVQQ